jgi:2'-5' RNA ligase
LQARPRLRNIRSMTVVPTGRLRLFFALWPDPPARQLLADIATAVARDRDGRATPPAALHVTVAFLGSVEAGLLPLVEAAGAAAASTTQPFTATFDLPGGPGRSGIAWLGCTEPSAGLITLHGLLAAALAARGLPVEPRAYRPHVTLARDCTRPAPGEAPDGSPVSWLADRLALVASTPGGGTSTYRTLHGWPLAG